MTGVLLAAGVFVAVVIVIAAASLGVAIVLGGAIHITDQAVAPAGSQIPAPSAAEVADLVDFDAVAADDDYIDALAGGHTDDPDDPTLTRMFAAYRDEARDGN